MNCQNNYVINNIRNYNQIVKQKKDSLNSSKVSFNQSFHSQFKTNYDLNNNLDESSTF